MTAEVKQFTGASEGTSPNYKVEIFVNEGELEHIWKVINAYPHIVTRLETSKA